MKVISFILEGKMAHFRKYYSNSTSLSYIIPPVTTVKGIIAGLLGYDRDTYYELLNSSNCNIAVCVKSPLKKITQTMNLLKIDKSGNKVIGLNGSGLNRTQNNMEFVVPKNIIDSSIKYKIYFNHSNDEIMERLIQLICTENKFYKSRGISVALGSAQCLGWISDGHVEYITEEFIKDMYYDLESTVCTSYLDKLDVNYNIGLVKEETFIDFDKDRRITTSSKRDIISTNNGNPIRVKFNTNFKSIFKTKDDYICFMG